MLCYGLEILLPTGKILDQLNIHYKKVLKQILSLYINVADPAIYTLSGLLPIEAEIHTKALTFFGNITRSEHTRGGSRGGGGGAHPVRAPPKIGKNMIFFGIKS